MEGEDWVVTGKNLNGWIRRLWRIDDPHRFYGWSLGTATNIGISLGVALAYKGSNATVIDIQADGDLMYDCGALWVGARQQIPFLVIMYNNRAYGNSLRHQTAVARQRGRKIENASIGTEIDNPAPDFAELANSMGCRGIGPVEDPDGVRPALEEAMAQLRLYKVPVLVDVVCE